MIPNQRKKEELRRSSYVAVCPGLISMISMFGPSPVPVSASPEFVYSLAVNVPAVIVLPRRPSNQFTDGQCHKPNRHNLTCTRFSTTRVRV